MKINIYDHSTGKVIEREMNSDEQNNYDLIQLEAEKEAQFETNRKLAREATIAKLGLTADEVASLFN